MATKPLEIGITGGIGSGKSIICSIFNRLGIPSYNADSRAKWLTDNDPEVRKAISLEFGDQAYDPGGKLDRKLMAQWVFNQSDKIKTLNQIIHPVVGQDYRNWVSNQKSAYVLKEAALIFESGSNQQLTAVITVFAPPDLRIKRVLKRDPNRNRDQVEKIISKQWTEENRQEQADYVIYNDGESLVIPQVLTIHDQLMLLANNREA